MRIVRCLASTALYIALGLFGIAFPKVAGCVYGLAFVIVLLHAVITGKQKNEGMH